MALAQARLNRGSAWFALCVAVPARVVSAETPGVGRDAPGALATWLTAGLTVLAGAAIVALAWVYLRRRRERVARLKPDWEQRALRAERRADEAEAVVRAGLLPYVARLLRSKLLLGLMSQRSSLLQTQHAGAERVVQLEQRLADAHSQLEARLQSYEQRISELREGSVSQAMPRPEPAPTAAGQAVRKNPLLAPTPPVETPPVHFADIMARRKPKE
jgi:hypothetical protein